MPYSYLKPKTFGPEGATRDVQKFGNKPFGPSTSGNFIPNFNPSLKTLNKNTGAGAVAPVAPVGGAGGARGAQKVFTPPAQTQTGPVMESPGFQTPQGGGKKYKPQKQKGRTVR
jgi:hypothetical protein